MLIQKESIGYGTAGTVMSNGRANEFIEDALEYSYGGCELTYICAFPLELESNTGSKIFCGYSEKTLEGLPKDQHDFKCLMTDICDCLGYVPAEFILAINQRDVDGDKKYILNPKHYSAMNENEKRNFFSRIVKELETKTMEFCEETTRKIILKRMVTKPYTYEEAERYERNGYEEQNLNQLYRYTNEGKHIQPNSEKIANIIQTDNQKNGHCIYNQDGVAVVKSGNQKEVEQDIKESNEASVENDEKRDYYKDKKEYIDACVKLSTQETFVGNVDKPMPAKHYILLNGLHVYIGKLENGDECVTVSCNELIDDTTKAYIEYQVHTNELGEKEELIQSVMKKTIADDVEKSNLECKIKYYPSEKSISPEVSFNGTYVVTLTNGKEYKNKDNIDLPLDELELKIMKSYLQKINFEIQPDTSIEEMIIETGCNSMCKHAKERLEDAFESAKKLNSNLANIKSLSQSNPSHGDEKQENSEEESLDVLIKKLRGFDVSKLEQASKLLDQLEKDYDENDKNDTLEGYDYDE